MTGPESEVSDEEILRLMALAPAPVVTVSDLQADLPYTSENIRYRLSRMEDNGYVKSMTVGASAKVFWLTDSGKERLASTD